MSNLLETMDSTTLTYGVLVGVACVGVSLLCKGMMSSGKAVKEHECVCIPAHEKLLNQNKEFDKKEVIEVSTGVYVAIGYGLANCIMIEGNDGVIIVDCMECPQTAEDVAEAFHKICTKPVVAIIYTHNHQDHTGGAKAFMKYAKERKCDIYAHRLTSEIISKFVSKTGTIAFIRGARQFGQYLSNKQHINSGIGPCLTFDENTAFDVQLPTITFDSELVVTISGVLLKLIHVPGETDDQICVYLPQKSLLCPADNIYKAFPNLYAIRGTPTRDALEWAHSLDIMKNLMADILVPSHTRPLHGRDTIAETFDAYRDGILFVHDQTVRLMNKGYFIDDIVPLISLPPHLLNHPYLQEFYGTVAWGVRGVFNSYIGWFGGDPAQLHPLSPQEYAERMQRLAGGADGLLLAAKCAFADGDSQWCLNCSQAIMRANSGKVEVVNDARQLALQSLRALASNQVSANGRNYYLTYARELEGSLTLKPSSGQVTSVVKHIGAVEVIKSLTIRLNAESCIDVICKVVYLFPDVKKAVYIAIDRGVARSDDIDYEDSFEDAVQKHGADLVVTVNASVFEELAARLRNKSASVLSGDMRIEGKGLTSSIALKKFMGHFEDSATEFIAPI